ncbi:MAG: SDR family oxidoreductase [Phycisphaeraceae bacterium]|nr:MAG: SDR family oxidoreductase [Phycisphaeraceae bacterium]
MTTYLITGATRGIGLELARQLRGLGRRVVATARDPGRAAELAQAGATIVALEAADPGSIASFPSRLADAGVRAVDVLINNAGVNAEGCSWGAVTAPEFLRVLNVNTVAPVLVTQALLPLLRAGHAKLVVNISSILGSIAQNSGASNIPYCASKAALNQASVSMAHALKPHGVRVVAIHPGWVRTDMGGQNAPLEPAQSAASILATLDRLSPDDTACFLNYDGTPIPW